MKKNTLKKIGVAILLVGLVILPSVVGAEVTGDAVATIAGETTQDNNFAFTTAGTGNAITVCVLSASSKSINSITFGGKTLTQVAISGITSVGNVTFGYATTTATSSNVNIFGSAAAYTSVTVASWNGVDGFDTGFLGTKTNLTGVSSESYASTTTKTDTLPVACIGTGGNGTFSAGTNTTKQINSTDNVSAIFKATSSLALPSANTMNFNTSSGNNWGIIGLGLSSSTPTSGGTTSICRIRGIGACH